MLMPTLLYTEMFPNSDNFVICFRQEYRMRRLLSFRCRSTVVKFTIIHTISSRPHRPESSLL